LLVATDEDQEALRAAETQSILRAGNERTRASALRYKFEPTQRVPFLCECADQRCTEIVMLSLADYERIREYPKRFLLVAGHEDAEADYEQIIEAENGYAIIEKIGPAGIKSALLDPRRHSQA
jgi:hypothetical protein